MKALREEIARHAPLTVISATWDAETLILRGNDWFFQSSGSWRLVGGGCIEFSCLDASAASQLQGLCGKRLISLGSQSRHLEDDPALLFEDDRVLEIFSLSSYEPWSFHSASEKVFIGFT
jgi:hypothetical protein